MRATYSKPEEYWRGSSVVLGYMGSLVKGDILYGMPLAEILKKPKFMLRYFDRLITSEYYLYDYRTSSLIDPWGTEENIILLANIANAGLKGLAEYNVLGISPRKASFYREHLTRSQFCLDKTHIPAL